ncbi:SRPBCC family protein [Georgenia sp. AZ-5]|uniref:SRPBCC family protein n=1 Tax=Georgenia sp. AZ-5 TaxID=3367526 RepID=UPI003754E514
MESKTAQESGTSTGKLPIDALKGSAGGFARALGGRAVDKLTDRVGGVADRLTAYASGEKAPSAGEGEQGGDGDGVSAKAAAAGKAAEKMAEGESPVKAGLSAAATGVKEKVKGVFGGGGKGKGKGGKKFKFNNFVESFDVGVPVEVAYNQWTEYDRWPDFMKKLEHAELNKDDGKVKFKGQVFWSHREWETSIKEQVPYKRIVWDSTGRKGHISGAVTFQPLGEELTRIAVILEYHPQGLMEKTANIWRAANRRMRLELKFWQRYVMTQAVLHPEDLEGYHAEIHDKEIVRTHEDVLEEEERARAEEEEAEAGDEYEEEPEEAGAEGEEYAEGEAEEGEPEEEYEEGEAEEGEAEEEAEPQPARRTR